MEGTRTRTRSGGEVAVGWRREEEEQVGGVSYIVGKDRRRMVWVGISGGH